MTRLSDVVERIARHDRCVVRGPAECGKSGLAERALAGRNCELEYFATLERSPATAEVIARHAARRDSRWHVHELRGAPERDFPLLERVLGESQRPLLFDGFVTLLARLGYDDDGRMNVHAGRLVLELRDLLRKREAPWVLVDPDVETVRAFCLPGLAAVVEHFYAIVAAECRVITVRLS